MQGQPDLPKYQLARLSADAVVLAGPCRIMAVLADGVTAAWAVALHNDVDSAGGDPVLNLSGGAGTGQTFFDFTNLGGVLFGTGCYANITVTSGFVYVWYEGHSPNQMASH